MTEKQWTIAIHLSGLCGLFIPLGNILGPLVIWLIKKDESPLIDAHGKAAVNFQISYAIYIAICIVLMFTIILTIIAIPALVVIGVLNIVFAIVAAVQADKGNLYDYPFTIKFVN